MVDILPARTILTGQVSTKLWADPLSSLADWRYDGSTAARRRLIYEFPLVALRTTTSDIADH